MSKVSLETEKKITLSQKHAIDKKIHNSSLIGERLKSNITFPWASPFDQVS